MFSITWLALLCDFTIVLIVTLLAVPHDDDVRMAVAYNDAVFSSLGICESRGMWRASETYIPGQCVWYAKDNCIYVRHDGSADRETFITTSKNYSHQWVPGGPKREHFVVAVCLPRVDGDIAHVPRVEEIPHLVYLQMLNDSITEYCASPKRTPQLYDWLTIDHNGSKSKMCFIETIGVTTLPTAAGEMFSRNFPHYFDQNTSHHSLMMHSLMESEHCYGASEIFYESIVTLSLMHTLRVLCLCLAMLVYMGLWYEVRRRYNCTVSYWAGAAHFALFTWMIVMCSEYLTGSQQAKIVRFFYGFMCPEPGFIYFHLFVAVAYYLSAGIYLINLCGEVAKSVYPRWYEKFERSARSAPVSKNAVVAKKKDKKAAEKKKTK